MMRQGLKMGGKWRERALGNDSWFSYLGKFLWCMAMSFILS